MNTPGETRPSVQGDTRITKKPPDVNQSWIKWHQHQNERSGPTLMAKEDEKLLTTKMMFCPNVEL